MRRGRRPADKPSKKELIDLYVSQDWTLEDLIAKYGTSFTTLYRWIDGYGIPRRGRSEAAKLGVERMKARGLTLTPQCLILGRGEVEGRWVENYDKDLPTFSCSHPNQKPNVFIRFWRWCFGQ